MDWGRRAVIFGNSQTQVCYHYQGHTKHYIDRILSDNVKHQVSTQVSSA
jgi:hypothetical protein